MFARLTILALALATLAGCVVAPARPYYGYGYGYYAPRPYYGGWGYYRPYGWHRW